VTIKPGALLRPSTIRQAEGEVRRLQDNPRQILKCETNQRFQVKRSWAIAPGFFVIVFQPALKNSVFLRIFRKILDLVTFFSQKGSASGWFEGLNGQTILS
jgi:hypothetical protein